MPENTQKQIASKYKEDLTYYKKTHPMRRLRFWLSVLALLGGSVWALGFHKLGGTPQFFNTGPISQNHASFANDCSACHRGASTDMLSILPVSKAHQALMQPKTPVLDALKEAGGRALDTAKESISDPHKLAHSMLAALGTLNLDNIDRACLVCHDGMALHQPGAKAVRFREMSREMSVVAAAACSSCHKEHVGSARMKLPTAETCTSCHGDEARLKASLTIAQYDGKMVEMAHGRNWRQGDVVQWVPPTPATTEPKVIRAFADADPKFSHPPFLYENKQATDDARILFNHARHVGALNASGGRDQAKGINLLNGQALDCRDCHTPEPNGVGMQRIEYAKHCQSCHSLGVDPKLPDLSIPHRDPEKVRAFLTSMRSQWMFHAKERYNITDAATLDAFWRQREAEFLQDWPQGKTPLETFSLWENRVFYTGIPPIEQAPNGQRLPSCTKCHMLDKVPGSDLPRVQPTAIPDQWLTRGPFKHAAHLHMNCLDCHAAAEKSKLTTDISLPSQQMCAECHRPRDYARVEMSPTQRVAPTFGQFSPAAALKQRTEGGVFDSCLGCHKYHVPAAEMEIARSLKEIATGP